MRKVLTSLLGVYVVLAATSRVAERMGAVRCGCASTCWCQDAPMSAFRWVFPWGHRTRADST